MVSDAWKNISAEERAKYDEMAKKDRERYEQEKAMYVAPPSVRKKQRDPTAPRRPMSAFLAFANSRRAKVKGERPQCSNGEISKILSNMWKEADKDIKQKYRDDEAALWAKYKADMSEWRKNNEIRLKQAKAEMEAEVEAWAARKKMRTDGVKLLQEAGLEDHMISGLPSRQFDYPNPSDEMIAATALRGVRGGSNPLLGQGLPVGLDEATLHQKHLYHAQAAANYSNLIRNGLGAAYSSGLGAANAPGGLGSNISNMALLEMGMAYPQQLAGLQFGNPQAALMAQALHGTTSAHHNPLIALAGRLYRSMRITLVHEQPLTATLFFISPFALNFYSRATIEAPFPTGISCWLSKLFWST